MASKPSIEYRAVELKKGYGVQITQPGHAPRTISGFATEAEAEAWADKERKSAPDVSQRAKSIVDRVTRDR
jgi:hypothetical protein